MGTLNLRVSIVALVVLGAAGLAVASPASAAPWTLNLTDHASKAGGSVPDSASFSVAAGTLPAEAQPVAQVLRGSTVLATDAGPDTTDASGAVGAVSPRSLQLAAGDRLRVIDHVTGQPYAETTFDGLPVFAASTCAGAKSATGTRTAGSVVTRAGAYAYSRGLPGYGTTGTRIVTGTVTSGAVGGTDFSAAFDLTLTAKQLLWAESTRTAADVTTNTYVERRVRACPKPADTRAPKAKVVVPKRLSRMRLAKLARSLVFTITSDEAATLKATATLRTSTGKGKHRRTRSVVITSLRRELAAGKATTVNVTLGRPAQKRMRRARKAKGRLIVALTLTDAAGNTTTLPTTSVRVPTK